MKKIASRAVLSCLIVVSLVLSARAQNIPAPVSPPSAATNQPPGAANATGIKQTNESNESETFFPTLKDDLVNTGSPYLASVKHDDYTNYEACRIEALNDGEIGKAGNQADVAFALNGTWTTTFVLNTEKAPMGYDIQEIHTIAGWPANRANQKYELLISKIGNPDTFVSLGIFQDVIDRSGSTKITLAGEKGVIESGVAAIRFQIMVPTGGSQSETAYREIDVIGVPSKK